MPRMCDWLVTFFLPELQPHRHCTGEKKRALKLSGSSTRLAAQNFSKTYQSINHLVRYHPFLTHSPLSRRSIFVLVSKLPKVLSHPPPPNVKSAHPFNWQHTPHTVKSKITSKSCFTFQVWRLYYNQLPARRRVRLLNYNQKNTQQFLGTVLVSHTHRSEVLL